MIVHHVAQVRISEDSGMGRVAHHWRVAFEAAGHVFRHIGPETPGCAVHPAWFSARALSASKQMPAADIVLAHEPAAAPFVLRRTPVVVFSHGLERRGWAVALQGSKRGEIRLRRRYRLLFPLWRLLPSDYALRRATAVLVLNRGDLEFVQRHYGRPKTAVSLFRNGVSPTKLSERDIDGLVPTALFIGSWLPRKGCGLLVDAAIELRRRGVAVRWLLAGTRVSTHQVRKDWPDELRDHVEVVEDFQSCEEESMLRRCSVFVLPSYFEGQPLALLQAMAAGRCCIASEIDAHTEIIRNGINGLMFPTGQAGNLADCLERALGDPALRYGLGRAARIAVADRTWDRVAREVVSLVEPLALIGRHFSPT